MKILENIQAFFKSATWLTILGYALLASPALTVWLGSLGLMNFNVVTLLASIQTILGAAIIILQRYQLGLMTISSSTLWSTALAAISILSVGIANHTNYLAIVDGLSGLTDVDFYRDINPLVSTIKSEIGIILSLLSTNTAMVRFKKYRKV